MHTTTTIDRMTSKEFNKRYPIGTPVTVYPDRREDPPLVTQTRTAAGTIPGGGLHVVSVEGWPGSILLENVDPHDMVPPPGPDVITRRKVACINKKFADSLLAVLRADEVMCTRSALTCVYYAADDESAAEIEDYAISRGWAIPAELDNR